MMRKLSVFCVVLLLCGLSNATTVTVGDYDFTDAGQPTSVTLTNNDALGARTNDFLSDYALPQSLTLPSLWGGFVGDYQEISMGVDDPIGMITMHFDGYEVTAGSVFVAFESQWANDTDELNWEFMINGSGTYYDASSYSFLSEVGTNAPHNQFVFNLTDFGLSVGDTVTSITIQNTASSPEFTFGGIAVPEPATMALLGLGGLMLRRRNKA